MLHPDMVLDNRMDRYGFIACTQNNALSSGEVGNRVTTVKSLKDHGKYVNKNANNLTSNFKSNEAQNKQQVCPNHRNSKLTELNGALPTVSSVIR
jgi:hypothetical protein